MFGCRKKVVVDGASCLLDILDTSGQEEHGLIREQSMMEAEGFLFVFAVNNAESWDKFPEWREKIQRMKEKDEVRVLRPTENK